MNRHPGSWGATFAARRWAAWLLLGLLVPVMTLLAWPVSNVLATAPGLAVSWRAALHEATDLGLTFGRDILFTYGPLGYLSVPRFFDAHTGTMAVLTTAILTAGFIATATLITRIRWGPAVTIIAVLVASRFTAIIDPMVGPVLAVLAWASLLAYRRFPFPATTFAIIGASVLGAVLTLMKFNAGVSTLAVVAAMTVAAMPRRPWLALVAVVSTAASLAGTWFVLGQDLGALPAFVRGSWEVASGYSAAMALPIPMWQLPAAALALGLVLLGAYLSSRDLERPHRVGLILGITAVLFFAWKHGIVRQGLDGFFAEVIVIGLLAVDWRAVDRRLPPVALGVPLAFFILASHQPAALLDAGRSAETAKGQIATALTPGAAEETTQRVRQSLRLAYALPPAILASIAGQTTHIEGWETAVAVAYPEMSWRPAPTFQSYAVFTRSLDNMNARFLRADDGPQRILRQRPRAIDGRYWLFEGPETTLTMLCRYYEASVTVRWQVLARGPDRCGPEQVIWSVNASEGEPVPVPSIDSASMLIGVRISGVASGVAASIQSAVYRGSIWRVHLDDRQYRLVPGTASGPLLLGTSAALGYADGYGISRTVRRISVEDEEGRGSSELTYTFFRVPVTPGLQEPGS